jgi:serine beta-lactamase-like protein LACTB, mitochondrial
MSTNSSNHRTPTWLTVLGLGVGVLVAVGLGIFSFLNALSTPLHPNPQEVPSAVEVPPSPAWVSAVELGRQQARAGLVEQNLPGLSVAVGVGDELVWAEGFGWADLDKRTPVSPRMRFRIGHVSKALTSAGVGVLLEKSRMRLDGEIQTYVPAFPAKDWPITLRQLMGHMAGLRHYETETDYRPSAGCERASDGLQSFADDPLLFEPGTQYRYSTYGWILVSAAVEAAADEPFFTFMRRQVFEPLGMSGTTVDSASEPIPDRVTFYYPRFSGDPSTGPEPAGTVDYSCFAGAGAFLSTPSDLVRFGIALETGTLLKRSTVANLQMPQLLASGKETDYGLGWMLNTVPLAGEATREVGHASLTLLGGSTSFLIFPERGIVVAVMSNTSRAGTRSIASRIAEAFARR